MNDIAKQLRTNADFVLGGTGMPPGAAIAGALQMGADEIDRLTRELDEARKLYEVTHSALFGATQRIDELESRLAWRKVGETEPPCEEVLCVYDDGECHVLAYSKDHARWYRQMDGAALWADPTHWMPLPAAPNEAEPT